MPERLFREVALAVAGETMPDLTIILDIEPDTALQRRMARSAEAVEDPAEATRDFARIRNGFLSLVRREPGRFRVIDASQSEEKVADLILAEVKNSGLIK